MELHYCRECIVTPALNLHHHAKRTGLVSYKNCSEASNQSLYRSFEMSFLFDKPSCDRIFD